MYVTMYLSFLLWIDVWTISSLKLSQSDNKHTLGFYVYKSFSRLNVWEWFS